MDSGRDPLRMKGEDAGGHRGSTHGPKRTEERERQPSLECEVPS